MDAPQYSKTFTQRPYYSTVPSSCLMTLIPWFLAILSSFGNQGEHSGKGPGSQRSRFRAWRSARREEHSVNTTDD
jgi:hypothetical protein